LSNASVTLLQGGRYVWAPSTTDVRALQSPDQSTRKAATYWDGSQLKVRLDFSSAYSGQLHLYAVDWDGVERRESIAVDDGSGPRSASIDKDFSQGAWVSLPISVASGGSVTITVTLTGASGNAVLSGIFLG
jgi:hypothetical protein